MNKTFDIEKIKALQLEADRPILILIRGIPGSGKGSLGKRIVENCDNFVKYEAQDYFKENPNIPYRSETLETAHVNCHRATKLALSHGVNVVVCNTFIRLWELNSYIGLRDKYEVKVIELHNDFGSMYNISEEKLEKMRRSFQPIIDGRRRLVLE